MGLFSTHLGVSTDTHSTPVQTYNSGCQNNEFCSDGLLFFLAGHVVLIPIKNCEKAQRVISPESAATDGLRKCVKRSLSLRIRSFRDKSPPSERNFSLTASSLISTSSVLAGKNLALIREGGNI